MFTSRGISNEDELLLEVDMVGDRWNEQGTMQGASAMMKLLKLHSSLVLRSPHGPYGFPGRFYQKYWNYVGPVIFLAILEFFSTAKMP